MPIKTTISLWLFNPQMPGSCYATQFVYCTISVVDGDDKSVTVNYSCQQGLLVDGEIEVFAGDNKV